MQINTLKLLINDYLMKQQFDKSYLKNKGEDSKFGDNFLYFFEHPKKIYIGDNHRLSLWCWLDFIPDNEYGKYNLIYIDQHIDCRCTDFSKRYKKFLENKEYVNDLDNFRKLSRYRRI